MSPNDRSGTLLSRTDKILDAAMRAAEAYHRQDLGDRLVVARDRLGQPDIQALVVGEFKKGKSTLVNALLNAPLCPVSDEMATVVPTLVRHGVEPSASVVTAAADGEAAEAETARQAIRVDEIGQWASEHGNLDNSRSIQAVEVRVPRALLASGLALVDTPGVGGLHSMHGAATMAVLGSAEVIIFVTDASQELSAMEIDFMRTARESCPTVVCVLTKTDLYPSWRRIAELDRGHLDRAGLEQVEVLPVSSVLRQEALAQSSRELNAESGYPELLRFINDSVIARAQTVAISTAVNSVQFVIDQLEGTFRAEREVLADPEQGSALVAGHERAKGRAEQLRTISARWQQTLGDGCQDLASEVDHDLRQRLRSVGAKADEAFDAHDPLDVWDDFVGWLRREVANEVAHNAMFLRDSSNRLALKVSEHFAIEEAALVHVVDVGSVPRIDAMLDAEFEKFGAGSGILTAMRGSYGGILMFGMMGQVAGLALLNPVTAVVGLGLGRKALRDEKKRQLTMRRQQAKQACRKFLDEVSFAVNKESRDAIRRVQRDLRDEFTDRAEQLQRSTREALAAAEAAMNQSEGDRRRRTAELDAELERLALVRSAADAVAQACRNADLEVAA